MEICHVFTLKSQQFNTIIYKYYINKNIHNKLRVEKIKWEDYHKISWEWDVPKMVQNLFTVYYCWRWHLSTPWPFLLKENQQLAFYFVCTHLINYVRNLSSTKTCENNPKGNRVLFLQSWSPSFSFLLQ